MRHKHRGWQEVWEEGVFLLVGCSLAYDLHYRETHSFVPDVVR